MAKKTHLQQTFLYADALGKLLKDGTVESIKGTRLIVRQTRTVRGKKVTEVYHLPLSGMVAFVEVDADLVETDKKVDATPRKKPGRKPKAAVDPNAEKAPRKKPGRKPKAAADTASATDAAPAEPPKKRGPKPGSKRKKRTEAPAAPVATTESVAAAVDPEKPQAPSRPTPIEDPPPAKKRGRKPKTSPPADVAAVPEPVAEVPKAEPKSSSAVPWSDATYSDEEYEI